jgi:dTDP-4-dehydrorhamnose reductase
MNVCILGVGSIGYSLYQSLSSKSDKIHLSSSRQKIQFMSQNDRIHSYQYGDIAKIGNKIEIEKCIITTRIDLLTEENKRSIYDDIRSLASIGCEFINLSSVAVYGSSQFPRNEDSELNPVNEYGEMKLNIEIKLREIIHHEKLTNLRVANLYGNVLFDDLTNKTLKNLVSNKKISIANNRSLRDFITYKDLQVFLEDWVLNRISCSGEMNFASGVSISVEDWINSICRITNKTADLNKDFTETLQYSVIDPQKLKNSWNKSLMDTNTGLVDYINTFNCKESL